MNTTHAIMRGLLRPFLILVVGALLLAGCAPSLEVGAEEHDTRPKKSVLYTFEDTQKDRFPKGFLSGMTGEWKATEWKVLALEGNHVLAHIGFWYEDPHAVYPVCWVKNSAAKDLTLSVRLYPLRPPADIKTAIHDGAGIVVRFMDPDNYYLLRAVPHETRVRLYKVQNGKRKTFRGRNLEIELEKWHELKLKAEGDTFTAYFDGEKLFHFKDDTFEHAGAYGLWCKPNNVTYFDDLKAEINR